MLARIMTAIIGIPVVLLTIYLGGPVFLILLAIAAALALTEFYQLLKLPFSFSLTAALLSVIPYYANGYFNQVNLEIYILVYLIIAASISFVFFYDRLDFLKASGIVLGGIFLPFLSFTLFQVRSMENGVILTLSVLLLTWGTDTGAFFCGSFCSKYFGGSKLAPKISPNKSWAGAWGGLFTAVIIALVFGILTDANLLYFAIWGIVTSCLGQIGDLVESAFKRYSGVKDSGNLLPGHGGFLDRLDSLLFTAAVSYIFFGMVV